MNKIFFDFGIFEIEKKMIIDRNNIPFMKGKFNLNFTPIRNEFYNDFYFYDPEKIQEHEWIDNEIQQFDELVCLGPYFPLREQYNYSIFPNFSQILLYSKTRKILDSQNDSSLSETIKHQRTKGRKEQLQILSNLFGYFLKNNRISDGILIPVPSKPDYSFNSVDIIAQELAKVLHKDLINILKRDSVEEKRFSINPLHSNSIPKKLFLVDDIYTSGETMQVITNLLKRNGAENISILCLGRTDYTVYYGL